MTIYYVGCEEFYSLKAAKAAMKRTGMVGTKVKVYSNGDFVPCGGISLSGSNRSFIANSPGGMKRGNY